MFCRSPGSSYSYLTGTFKCVIGNRCALFYRMLSDGEFITFAFFNRDIGRSPPILRFIGTNNAGAKSGTRPGAVIVVYLKRT